ncbi:hypothetical protein [Microbulbifer agarilyticus]|uniref:hypothetical protein n=1 Tax=Microbulbifer agarilyticus TaxID=260552 RepID=UPI001CD4337A|nr:hypothetical protein [Microbulbifer agarilyticus]MCA0894597.1 hypothetical protein [Microbulbifer agarilyticus]
MQEFSLEKISEQIHYGKTKKYFQEVLSSYNNGNYRSSVVMLWSVTICDIVYKLQNLIDLYDDAAAKEILREVTTIQNEDYKSSAWEIKLLDDVHDKTHLLDSSEYEDLRYLQKQRHLSAHPVLNSERELHSPNKETVRSLLRNTLEGLLIKPPFYTQRITKELLEDLAESTDVLNDRKKVKKYIESRYLSRTTPSVEINIFRSLWKLVFKLDNEACEKNRTINLHALEVLSDRNIASIPNEVQGDTDYYSNIASNGTPLSYLVFYLSNNHQIYQILSDDARLKIDHCINTDDVGKTMGWFIKTDLDTHGNDIEEWIKSDQHPTFTTGQFDALLEVSDTEEWQKKFCRIVTEYYSASYSFDQADTRFQVAIPKYIGLFDRNSLIHLAEQIDNNGQCHARGRAREDYVVIKARIDELFDNDFDYSNTPAFRRRVVTVE